jgi:hypothetical protein
MESFPYSNIPKWGNKAEWKVFHIPTFQNSKIT